MTAWGCSEGVAGIVVEVGMLVTNATLTRYSMSVVRTQGT